MGHHKLTEATVLSIGNTKTANENKLLLRKLRTAIELHFAAELRRARKYLRNVRGGRPMMG